MRYNFRKVVIRWRIRKSIKVVLCIFALVGQGHGVQLSQWYPSIEKIDIYKKSSTAFLRQL